MAWFHHNRIIEQPFVMQYRLTLWGELIYGTKAQLQALGIGIDAEFPVTDRRRVKVTDPRGFATDIQFSPYMGEGIYSASIQFPDRERTDYKWMPYAPGVRMRDAFWFTEYVGSADSLVAAGIVQADKLPGQPGMGKVQVTLSNDGTRRTSQDRHLKRQPGDMTIIRVSKSQFKVQIIIPHEEGELRRKADRRREDAWEREMAVLPRPEPLRPLAAEVVLSRQIERSRHDRQFQAFLGALTK